MAGVRKRRGHIDTLAAGVGILSLNPVDLPRLEIRNRNRSINRRIQCDCQTIVMPGGHGGQWLNCLTSEAVEQPSARRARFCASVSLIFRRVALTAAMLGRLMLNSATPSPV